MKRFICCLLMFSSASFATTQTGVQTTTVGTESNGAVAYIGLTSNPNNCMYGGVYFSNPFDPKMALPVAMAAKVAGKTLRLEYTIGADQLCRGTGIYIE